MPTKLAMLDIDWNIEGRQSAYIQVPSSTNTSAWQNLHRDDTVVVIAVDYVS
jgi:hypothetical protein